jgi:5-(carboxyamino)imidazole ribonucleotide synthase
MNRIVSEMKIGILGGGQLGRMLIHAGINWGLNFYVLDPDPEAPCSSINKNFSVGDITDYETVYNFGKELDLITIEIENVNTKALKKLQREGKKIYPQPEIIELVQNKLAQKKFYKSHKFPTADFVSVEKNTDLKSQVNFLPAVQKLNTEGYDGKGVIILKDSKDLSQGFDKPSFLEKLIDFDCEISVIVSRNEKNETLTYPLIRQVMDPKLNLVSHLIFPAQVESNIEIEARKTAEKLANQLKLIGIMAVEMFVTKDNQILINEVAPRPHNSGHHTIEASRTSQFEQHLRAILNLSLGNTETNPSAMINLIGEVNYYQNSKDMIITQLSKFDQTHLHLYEKKTTKPGRKMGHVTITGKDIFEVKEKVGEIKRILQNKAN